MDLAGVAEEIAEEVVVGVGFGGLEGEGEIEFADGIGLAPFLCEQGSEEETGLGVCGLAALRSGGEIAMQIAFRAPEVAANFKQRLGGEV